MGKYMKYLCNKAIYFTISLKFQIINHPIRTYLVAFTIIDTIYKFDTVITIILGGLYYFPRLV